MKRDLREIVVQAQLDGDTRVVVFSGSGTSFCAGDNIFSGRDPDEQMPSLVPPRHSAGPRHQVDQQSSLQLYSQELIRSVWMLDKPTVAVLNGVAIQTGLSIALACDFRIASVNARLGSATLRFAFLPDEGGHWLLLQYLGLARATDFLLRKRIVDAAQALELGLVNEVVPHDRLQARAMELSAELADGPQVAMRFLKRSLRNATTLTFDQAGEDIATKTAISDHHPDTREGVAAWRERREPKFNQWLSEPADSPGPGWLEVSERRPAT
jgi:2-(1,2-epoxy-1,2-dihydrophenyl)acetyl-CoA isomerase